MSRGTRESLATDFDEVARNQIWREQLRREYMQETSLTPFQINPKTLSSIALKPTQITPADFKRKSDTDNPSDEFFEKLATPFSRPSDRSNRPITEAQRIGWHHDSAFHGVYRDMQKRMSKGKTSCDVTKFADSYSAMSGCSPFAEKSTR